MSARQVSRSSAAYPALLREVGAPPAKLWVDGADLDSGPAVAVVGTRRASAYGLQAAAWLAGGLAAAGVTVVSGLARGIDAAAHLGALEAGGRTVAVLGCGIDVCYPNANRELHRQIRGRGSLVTEYAPGTPPLPHHFPIRNRIIAGVSLGVVIVEAPAGGGAMITARLAMENNREVFAVPGAVHSPVSVGPHALVRDGARLVTSAGEILEDLGLDPPGGAEGSGEESDAALHPDEARVLGVLEADPLLIDLIARRARLPVSGAAAVLAKLEVKGLASHRTGGRYVLSMGRSGSRR